MSLDTVGGLGAFYALTAPRLYGYTLIAVKKEVVLSDKSLTTFKIYAIIAKKTIYGENVMYMKDKLNRITLRLNDEQFEFVKSNSDLLDVSPSEFLRMVINATMVVSKIDTKEVSGRENDKTSVDDII